jgi:hypothetical protein
MKMLRRSLAVVFVSSLAALAQPNQGPGGHRGPPPAEALAACQGKAAEASCSFSHEGRNLTGTCFTPAADKPLACRPVGGPPGGPPPQGS